MGIEFELVNQTKKELISFCHLNGSKKENWLEVQHNLLLLLGICFKTKAMRFSS